MFDMFARLPLGCKAFKNPSSLFVKLNRVCHKLFNVGGENSIRSLRKIQEQSTIGFLKKMCSENVQHIYRRIPMSKCDFNKVVFCMGVLL